METKNLAKVTILTIFWKNNVDDFLLRYLGSINKLIEHSKKNYEVKVVLFDNSPEPSLKEYLGVNNIVLREDCYEVIEGDGSGFFAPDNNKIAKHAYTKYRPDYFLFLNPDTEISETALISLVETAGNKDVFCVDGRQWPFEHPKAYNRGTLETSWCSGACLLTRAKEFIEWGGFDENFVMYAEDVDLSWRAWENGYRCLYSPEAMCTHHCYGMAKDPYFRQFWNVRNGVMMRIKHGDIGDVGRYLRILGRAILVSLRSFQLTEPKNILRATLSGVVSSSGYIFSHKTSVNRPHFANFYGSEYARIVKIKKAI